MYQVNFLPWRKQNISRKKQVFYILLFIQSTMLIIAAYIIYALQQAEIHQLQLSYQQNQHQYQQSQKLIYEINHKQNQLNGLITKKQTIEQKTENNLSRLKLLHSIPTIVPQKCWLSNFSLLDEKIEIKANSYDFHDISKLITRLDKDPSIQTIQLANMGRSKDIHYLHLGAHHLGGHHE